MDAKTREELFEEFFLASLFKEEDAEDAIEKLEAAKEAKEAWMNLVDSQGLYQKQFSSDEVDFGISIDSNFSLELIDKEGLAGFEKVTLDSLRAAKEEKLEDFSCLPIALHFAEFFNYGADPETKVFNLNHRAKPVGRIGVNFLFDTNRLIDGSEIPQRLRDAEKNKSNSKPIAFDLSSDDALYGQLDRFNKHLEGSGESWDDYLVAIVGQIEFPSGSMYQPQGRWSLCYDRDRTEFIVHFGLESRAEASKEHFYSERFVVFLKKQKEFQFDQSRFVVVFEETK